ncbi:transmembrane protein 56-B [Hyposmocoma kahamanoa]|uniref:transmembrane protein 56-B n=1 Tax=Hyposmocoma kahamanoa TaxID=1477025 RepID=UPI000E6D6F15|nr:transmembrane protein 56-B [Hyposmocoma kahamanoa]
MWLLGACNAAALAAATNLVISLDPEDKISIKRGCGLTALGLVYFVSLFELLNVLALFTARGARFRHRYRLSAGDVLDITNKSVLLIYCCSYQLSYGSSSVWLGNWTRSLYLRGGLGDCVFGFVYLMELSTPFVSLRGILSRLHLKASKAYLINGILMLLTFFLCRVVSLPYVCLMYSRVLGLSYFEAIGSLPIGCKVSICILLLPQVYWFYLMSLGAVKVFVSRAASAAAAGDTKSS